MENQNKAQAEKIVDNFLEKQKYKKAAEVAENANLIDKQIQVYDSMIEMWGHIPIEAGYKMFDLGLLKKAKDYFEASGETSSPEYNKIKQAVFQSKEEFKEEQENTTFLYDDSEETHNIFELIYQIGEDIPHIVRELSKEISLNDLEKRMIFDLKGKN